MAALLTRDPPDEPVLHAWPGTSSSAADFRP
jgi:hypothetical protein